MIKAFYYNKGNFGDVLTPYLLKELFGIRCGHCIFPSGCNFIGIGSTLEKLQEVPVGTAIWGTGFMYEDTGEFDVSRFNILAVRGYLSSSRLVGKKEIPVGDPGLLISKIVKPAQKRYKIGFIPHYIDRSNENSEHIKNLSGVHYINIIQNVFSFIQEVSKCEYVISSSLHGCIAAEAFGIPNLHVMLSPKVLGLNYKFRDYYSAFHQKHKFVDFQKVRPGDISERRIMNSILTNYQKPTNLEEIQEGLMQAFENYYGAKRKV